MRRALDGSPPITNPFAQPGYGYFGKHAGYDYGVVNWTVKAPEAGTIIAVYTGRENVDGGNIVEMRSAKYDHRFLHLKSPSVKVGQVVTEGQVLGISGNTGNVGYHLHHDVRAKGTGWKDSFANYVDWEKLIKVQGVQDMPIPNADNYYYRYNKAMQRIRGRSMDRSEFNKNFVGNTDLRMLEAMLDNPEADNYYTLGQWAKTNKTMTEKQITDLQIALKNEQNKPPKEVIKEVEKIVEKTVEVEKPVDEKSVVLGILKRFWDSLFTKK